MAELLHRMPLSAAVIFTLQSRQPGAADGSALSPPPVPPSSKRQARDIGPKGFDQGLD